MAGRGPGPAAPSTDRVRAHRARKRALGAQQQQALHLAGFREHLRVQGHSRATAKVYSERIARLLRAVGVDGLARADTATLLGIWPAGGPAGLSASYHNGIRDALRWWYRYVGVDGAGLDGVPAHRKPPRLPRPYTEAERVRYLGASQALGPRHEALAGLGIYAGLRAGEVARLRWSDVTPTVLMVTGKAGRERRVPVVRELRAALNRYRASARVGEWVYPSQRGDTPHLTPSQVWRLHREIAHDANVSGGYHRCRHTFGTAVYRHTLDLLKTQQYLGHSQPTTTVGYVLAATTPEDLEGLYEPRLDFGRPYGGG